MTALKNKRGSLTVEAAIVLPLIIISMICLMSIPSIYATGENVVFSMCDEMMFANIEAAAFNEGVSLPVLTALRVKSENSMLSNVFLTDYDYRHEAGGMKDLISMEISGTYSFPGVPISEKVRSRAFSGLYKPTQEKENFEDSDDPEVVYIFPMRGEKYHNRECAFLNPACQQVFLTEMIRSKFNPCSICKSADAKTGESVYCFFKDGTVFHKGNCSMVDKYYVEIEKRDALAQGYMPCVACGG